MRQAADVRGLSPWDYVRQQLAFAVALDSEAGEALDWEEDLRRLEEPGENIPADEAFDRFEQTIRARFPEAK